MGMLGIMIMEPGCKMFPPAQGVACRCVKKKPDLKIGNDSKPDVLNTSDNNNEPTNMKEKKDVFVNNDEGNEAVGDVEMTLANDDDDDYDERYDDHDEL